ncbi:MAG: hypothetical protein WDA53_02785 [Bacillota bacterium]
MQQSLMLRVVISFLGVAFILMGGLQVTLGIVGENTTATITTIRRDSGERSIGTSGRFTYTITYSFSLPNGETVDGFTKKIGTPDSFETAEISTIPVRYLPGFPYLNFPDDETGIKIEQVILILAGGFIFFIVNRKLTDEYGG